MLRVKERQLEYPLLNGCFQASGFHCQRVSSFEQYLQARRASICDADTAGVTNGVMLRAELIGGSRNKPTILYQPVIFCFQGYPETNNHVLRLECSHRL